MFKRLWLSKTFLIGEIIIFILVVFYFIKTYQEIYPLKKEYSKLKTQIESLRQENQILKERIDYLKLENNLEKEIKKNLGLGYPNEKFMIVNEPPTVLNNLPQKTFSDFFKKIYNFILKILP